MSGTVQRISVCLWFDDQAEEAVDFYLSIFKNSSVRSVTRYDEEGARGAGRPKGGGPISLVVSCQTQAEIDTFWTRLSTGGQEVECGWLKDRYGVSWQIVPAVLPEMLRDKDPEKSRRVMAAMLKMKKLDFAALTAAYERRSGSAA